MKNESQHSNTALPYLPIPAGLEPQPAAAPETNVFIVVRGCQAIEREQILELRVGDVVKKVDAEGDWLWGMCRGKEGWVDPGCVRRLTKEQVKQLATKRSQYRNPFKTSRQTHDTALLQKVQQEARAMKETSQFVDSLNWEADSVAPSENEERTVRPDTSQAVTKAVEAMSAARVKSLAFENRAPLSPSIGIDDADAAAAVEEEDEAEETHSRPPTQLPEVLASEEPFARPEGLLRPMITDSEDAPGESDSPKQDAPTTRPPVCVPCSQSFTPLNVRNTQVASTVAGNANGPDDGQTCKCGPCCGSRVLPNVRLTSVPAAAALLGFSNLKS